MTAALQIDALGGPALQHVLVTGASGFVGRRLCAALAAHGVEVTAVTRDEIDVPGATRMRAVGDFTAINDWRPWLDDIDAVAHLAALSHDGTRGADSTRFHAVNVDVSRRLAEAAVACGIRRFVYLSSIKVNGESSRRVDGSVHAYSSTDTPAPEDDYGRSKLAAEQTLAALWPAPTGALTVLRPPLVYGPQQKGNLLRLMHGVARGWRLPFGGLNNRRSLIYVDNLCDAIMSALGLATPGVRRYTLADVDVSTPDLVRALARALAVEPHMFYVPAIVLRGLACLPVIGGSVRRLTDSLVVDARAIESELGWCPRVEFDDAIALTCAAWREAQR